jgi:hypothetical protein
MNSLHSVLAFVEGWSNEGRVFYFLAGDAENLSGSGALDRAWD